MDMADADLWETIKDIEIKQKLMEGCIFRGEKTFSE